MRRLWRHFRACAFLTVLFVTFMVLFHDVGSTYKCGHEMSSTNTSFRTEPTETGNGRLTGNTQIQRNVTEAGASSTAAADLNVSYRSREMPSKHLFNCSNIHKLKIGHRVGLGYSKHVFLAHYKTKTVVVKMVSEGSHDVTTCMSRLLTEQKRTGAKDSREKQLWKCGILPHMKLLKEVLLMEQLKHPNILPLLGYCVRNENLLNANIQMKSAGAEAVYDYGSKLNIAALKRLPVNKRIETALELADLMHYLQTSPLGSLLYPDFKVEQFLLAHGHVMITDFDDVNDLEPACDGNIDNNNNTTSVNGKGQNPGQIQSCRYGLKCQGGLCIGVNALHNLKRTCDVFIYPLIESIPRQSNEYSDVFRTQYDTVMSYLNRIKNAMNSEPKSNDQSLQKPPNAFELKSLLRILKETLD